MKKIGIIDYEAGNLFSLENALKFLKFNYLISDNPKVLSKCSHIILPGVGAFAPAIKNLKKKKLDKFLKKVSDDKKPLLGICLGMQLFFERSNEYGNHKGLNLIKGRVKKIDFKLSKLPVVGWFKIKSKYKSFTHELNNKYVYLVHSYECMPENNKVICGYYRLNKKKKVICSIQKDNIFAVQFHPEKSDIDGMKVLKKFYGSR
tara:strand:+ start:240 stop:851 length:612 start_codon:yes stop_codon:yes gene_type:complete